MNTADRVLAHLEHAKGSFVSGRQIADELGLSRNGVWKAVKALQEAGYPIVGVTNKGYRLAADHARLSAASIARHLTTPGIEVEFHQSIGSTNNRAKELAALGAPEGTLVSADCQTSGKGRRGRTFASPAGCGAYFSLVIRPAFPLEAVTLVTSYTAVCVAEAIEEVCGVDAQIKWVNDVFARGHKVCGILTEASVQPESGQVDSMVIGIGINVTEPEGGYPAEIADVVHSVCGPGDADEGDLRARLIAAVVDRFFAEYADIPHAPHLERFRSRSILDGRNVHVEVGRESFDATVLGIDDDLRLRVRLADGGIRRLEHGEVHIPSSQL